MLKKSITYTDFNGEEVTEDFYFHLSKANLIELEMGRKGGMKEYLENIIASEDGVAIVSEFKKLILMAYGKRSDDGKRFIKTEELRDEFQSTEAYSSLFMELCLDAGAAAAFVNGIVPSDLQAEVTRMTANSDRAPNRAERRHPSDTAATPAPPYASMLDEEPAKEGGTVSNVFERPAEPGTPEVPRTLTRQELTEMDDAELRSGLAEGRYKLQ